MDREALLERLRGYEWDDLEVKAAQWEVPKDAYKTVSAFANTSGGWLVFGVAENTGKYEVVGVTQPDNVQNAFIGACRSDKFSRPVEVAPRQYNLEGAVVLAFYVRPAARFDKPLKVKVDKAWETFIRLGGGDHRCTEVEVARFLRDASTTTFDTASCDGATLADLDPGAIRWLRGAIALRTTQHAYPELDDAGWLGEVGLVRGEAPTNAAVLLFGRERAVTRLKPSGILLDFQLHHRPWTEETVESRWDDREVCDRNLVETLKAVFERLFRLSPQPFALEDATAQRTESFDYRAVREAFVNNLVHQDWSDPHRSARLDWWADQVLFENPGDSYVSVSAMLDGGASDMRNPLLVRLFRQAGFAEQAGSGVPSIVRSWRAAERIPPEIDNDPGQKRFRLTLHWGRMTTERDHAWFAALGVSVPPDGARLLAAARETGTFGRTAARLVTGLPARHVSTLLATLVTQGLLQVVDDAEEERWRLSPHVRSLWEQLPVAVMGTKPVGQSSEVLNAGHDPVNTGHDPVNTGHDPVNTGHDPVNTGHGPVNLVGTAARETELLAWLQANPGLRVPQLATALGWSSQTTKRIVTALKLTGRVRFDGAPKTGGYHVVEGGS